ncbi:hypothetical protein Tco_0746442 [Tanacetum coccineum]
MPSASATHLTITSNHLPRQHLWPPTSSPPPPTTHDASNHNASNHHPPDRPLPTISFQIHEETFFFVLSRMAARSCLTRSRVVFVVVRRWESEIFVVVVGKDDGFCVTISDAALRSAMKRIVIAFGPGFDDWEWRLATLPFAFGGLGVYSAGDVLNYAFLTCPPILCSKLCSACSKVFTRENNGDHDVSYADIIGIKHRHNVVRNTLVDICFQSGISAGKEVDIGLEKDAVTLLKRIQKFFVTQDIKVRVALHIFNRISFAIAKGVEAQIFGVGVSGGSEAILHAMNHLIERHGDDVGLLMLLVDFKNAFNLVDRDVMLREVHLHCLTTHVRWNSVTLTQLDCITGSTPYSHAKGCSRAWYLDNGTVVGDTLVVGKVLALIMEDGPRYGLHLDVNKTKVFWPKEDPRSRLTGLVMNRVAKTIELMDALAKINDHQCELLLLRPCTGISKLYFSMCTCSPHIFESAQRSFDVALHSSLKLIITTFGPRLGDWKWRLATLPFSFRGLGVYSASDVLNYAFLASRL